MPHTENGLSSRERSSSTTICSEPNQKKRSSVTQKEMQWVQQLRGHGYQKRRFEASLEKATPNTIVGFDTQFLVWYLAPRLTFMQKKKGGVGHGAAWRPPDE
uniref:Uncharacterized protein n=1 Tax=Eutreptiella gymnastica TaxID=73025 RepID=A0A7S4CIE9_9EUGL